MITTLWDIDQIASVLKGEIRHGDGSSIRITINGRRIGIRTSITLKPEKAQVQLFIESENKHARGFIGSVRLEGVERIIVNKDSGRVKFQRGDEELTIWSDARFSMR